MSLDIELDGVTVRSDTAGTDAVLEELEQHRRELTGYCYRMLGSAFEADDAVQETMVRAWRAIDSFEGRSSLRSWLYRIATNVCLDMLREPPAPRAADGPRPGAARRRLQRARRCPSTRGCHRSPTTASCPTAPTRPSWPRRARASGSRSSPRSSTCPPRQRAVLILREVLRWQATEVAELLDTTRGVGEQRAPARRGRRSRRAMSAGPDAAAAVDDEQQALLARYVDAFERYDIESLVDAPPRGRGHVDAAVRLLAARA